MQYQKGFYVKHGREKNSLNSGTLSTSSLLAYLVIFSQNARACKQILIRSNNGFDTNQLVVGCGATHTPLFPVIGGERGVVNPWFHASKTLS